MNRSERQELNKCNVKDLIALMNDPRYANNKSAQFGAVMGYLARHGMDPSRTKGEFYDLVYAAKNEFLAQDAKARKENPNAQNLGLSNPNIKAFIANPTEALQREFTAFAGRKENFPEDTDPDVIDFSNRLKTNAYILATELNIDKTFPVRRPYNAELVDVMGRLTKKIPENSKSPEAALKKANSGFFGTLFRRPSKEYKAFQEAFDQFRDPTKVYNSGNVENLEEKTTKYLKHLNPAFKYAKNMDKEAFLAGLSKGQRARASFALDVLDSIDEHKMEKDAMDELEAAAKGKPLKKAAEPAPVKNEQEKQADFQKNLEKDIEPAPEKKEEAPEKKETEAKEIGMGENDLAA